MKSYSVFFEIYGKKMKVTVEAETENQARKQVKNDIVFHKIEIVKNENPQSEYKDHTLENLKDIFGMK